MTVQCCVCKRVKQENEWVGRMLQPTLNVSHSYCPQCFEDSKLVMLTEMAAARAARMASKAAIA